MICDYLILDRFSDISSFLRFEKCFGPLFTKENKNFLSDAFQEICGPKKKYINFGRLILAYIKWKTNSSKNESFNKFMKTVFYGVQPIMVMAVPLHGIVDCIMVTLIFQLIEM